MRVLRKIPVALIAALLPLLAGCTDGLSPSPSNWFPTSSIYAYMKAVQDESGQVSTTVQLRDGPLTTSGYLYLSEGDKLYSSLDIAPQQLFNINGNLFSNSLNLSQRLKEMTARDLYSDFLLFTEILWGKPEYFAMHTQSAGNTAKVAYVGFERSGNLLTGDSSIVLPGGYQISAPLYDAVASRAAPLVLSWTNVDTAATMELDVAGSCADGSRYTKHIQLGADTGTATLNSADYYPAGGPAIDCRVALILQRVRIGGVSTQFAFGSFSGVQQRTVQITSNP